MTPEQQAVLEAHRARRQAALAAYEQGMKALQRQDFHGAAAAFGELVQGYPEEEELLDRARVYLKVCARETAEPARPESLDELVYAATVALNDGAFEESLAHLRRAVSRNGDDERVHFLLAVVYARTGRLGEAMTHLERAVALEPENRSLARHDADFEALRQDDRVRRLLERPAAGRRQGRRAGS